jgi:hypothetical protein
MIISNPMTTIIVNELLELQLRFLSSILYLLPTIRAEYCYVVMFGIGNVINVFAQNVGFANVFVRFLRKSSSENYRYFRELSSQKRKHFRFNPNLLYEFDAFIKN